MMDEVHREEEFILEGPLWIQIQALDKGLEVLVTRAQISKDGHKFELPIPEDKLKDFAGDTQEDDLFSQHFTSLAGDDSIFEDQLDFVIKFDDFEDVITLSKETFLDEFSTKLYSFEDRYYLYIEFPEDMYAENEIDNTISILLEYGQDTNITIHRIQEYGKCILDAEVFPNLRKFFG